MEVNTNINTSVLCAYIPAGQRVEHLTLNLHCVNHPHTSDMITEVVNRTLNIGVSKVMLVITDNDSNMAFKNEFVDQVLCEEHQKSRDDESEDKEFNLYQYCIDSKMILIFQANYFYI